VVERALAKDPAQRFPSMAALAKELRACLAEGEGELPPAPEDAAAQTLITRPAPAPPRVRRSRSRRRPLAWALLAVLVAGAAFAAVVLLGGGSHHGGGTGGGGGGGGGSGTAVQLRAVGDAYSAPGHPDSHASTAPSATDGSPTTSWITQSYSSQAFGGLLTGLGLVVDAGSSVKLAKLTVTTPTPGFTAEIQAGDSPTSGFTADSASQTVDGTTTFTLNGATARYYVVWITELPPGLRAEISEVTATS
jgi:hypothetical protein